MPTSLASAGPRARRRRYDQSLRRDARRGGPARDLGETLGEPFTLRIDQRGGARARDRIRPLAQRDAAGEQWADHLRFDQCIIRAATLPGIAIALDQAGAFGDLERHVGGHARRLDDERQPLLDRGLFLGVAPTARAETLELRQRPEAQIAGERGALDRHAEMGAPAAPLGVGENSSREAGRQDLAQLLEAGLEVVDDAERLAVRNTDLGADTRKPLG